MINDMKLHITLLEVFGEEESGQALALQWLFTPVIAFGNRTPIEMIHDGGIETVRITLERARWGIY